MSSSEGRALAQLLAGLAGTRPIDARRIAIVVAHPDDETIGVGGQLPRLEGITIVHVTDGAPRDLGDARAQGFDTAEAYAAARRRELEAAMALAGVPATALLTLDIPDQGAAHVMPEIAARLAALFAERDIELVLTHAYEGGHPDHDAIAFAVHRAVGRSAVVEMALYHAGPEALIVQTFPMPATGDAPTTLVRPLAPAELARKRAMLAQFATQRRVLEAFTDPVERFRPAPAYDFGVLPNGGRLHYERLDWGFTGEDWRALVAAASA